MRIEVFLKSGEVLDLTVCEELKMTQIMNHLDDLYGKNEWLHYLNIDEGYEYNKN